MTTMLLIFDLLLIITLIGLAWKAVTSADLFRGVILFIIFGLLMALCWARLRAPDIALAEAALGAGLTGTLFLSTIGAIRRREREASNGNQ